VHTSGKLQPLDVVVFSAFKAALNKAITGVLKADATREFNMFDYSSLLRAAYEKAFTRKNIQQSFRHCGLWPLDPSRILQAPLPKDIDQLTTELKSFG